MQGNIDRYLPVIFWITPVTPTFRSHNAGHVCVGEDDSRVRAISPSEQYLTIPFNGAIYKGETRIVCHKTSGLRCDCSVHNLVSGGLFSFYAI
jgi:hypothetical protein